MCWTHLWFPDEIRQLRRKDKRALGDVLAQNLDRMEHSCLLTLKALFPARFFLGSSSLQLSSLPTVALLFTFLFFFAVAFVALGFVPVLDGLPPFNAAWSSAANRASSFSIADDFIFLVSLPDIDVGVSTAWF